MINNTFTKPPKSSGNSSILDHVPANVKERVTTRVGNTATTNSQATHVGSGDPTGAGKIPAKYVGNSPPTGVGERKSDQSARVGQLDTSKSTKKMTGDERVTWEPITPTSDSDDEEAAKKKLMDRKRVVPAPSAVSAIGNVSKKDQAVVDVLRREVCHTLTTKLFNTVCLCLNGSY